MTIHKQGIFLGLGTNKGSREKNLTRALERIHTHRDIRILKVSSLYKSSPWGVEDQPWFLNAVCEIDTDISPLDLLRELKRMEQYLGRKISDVKWGPRKIDLDIILFHDSITETRDLFIPHKYLTGRLFVLMPLLELIPEGTHPKTGISFKDYLEEFPAEDRKKLCSLYTPKMN
jgi:2-amino-4-hydroxy-6-hydroxymethyldihydropteridine diphosphokinase